MHLVHKHSHYITTNANCCIISQTFFRSISYGCFHHPLKPYNLNKLCLLFDRNSCPREKGVKRQPEYVITPFFNRKYYANNRRNQCTTATLQCRRLRIRLTLNRAMCHAHLSGLCSSQTRDISALSELSQV